MERPDLLAPPKLTTRMYGRMVAGITAMMACVAAALTIGGYFSIGELAFKLLVSGAGAGLAIWLYSRMMKRARVARPERMPLIHAMASVAGLIPFYVMLTVLFQGTAISNAMRGNWFIVPAMFGMTLAGAGFARRSGDSLHCPHCEYEFKFGNPDDAPARCPECGKAWLGLLKKGRRLRSRKLIAIGVSLAIGSFVILNPIFYMTALAPHLPTPALFACLYLAPDSSFRVWDELGMRPLDERWVRVLSDRLIGLRSADQHNNSPSRWFEKLNAAGKIPADVLERYYSEGFRGRLSTPKHANVGKPFEVHMTVDRAVGGWTTQLALMFGGYTVGQDAEPVGRQDKSLWSYQLAPDVLARHRDVLKQTITPQHSGPLRIRATYWVAYVPSFTEVLKWQPDGSPSPIGTALWLKRFDEERTVQVD